MQATDTATASITAAERVWHTPELVMLILPHLARERVDLLVISLLSKALRNMALPFLVRTLDLYLPRLEAYALLFERHPHLAHSVRFVRIIDDHAATEFRNRDHSRSSKGCTSQWEEDPLEEDSVKDQQRRMINSFLKVNCPNARFDITAGVNSVYGVRAALIQPGIEENIVAMRWIADHVFAAANQDQWHSLSIAYTMQWKAVSRAIVNVIRAQRNSGVKLASVQINEHQFDTPNESLLMSELWHTFTDIPPAFISSVSINLSGLINEYPDECVLFEYDWPRLRRLTVDVGSEKGELTAQETYDVDVDSWISRHPLIEHLDIYCWADIPPLSLHNEFPNLKSISLKGCEPGNIGDFLLRHGNKLVELELPKFVTGGGVLAAIRPEARLPNLRVLRSSPRVAAALVDGQHAPQLTQIEFKPVQVFQELMIDEWILPHTHTAQTITCLDIELSGQTLSDALRGMAFTIFDSERFPALVELSMCSTHPNEAEESFDPRRHLKNLLRELKPLPSLRALRLEEMLIQPFPSASQPIAFKTLFAPPKLEYLSWHSPDYNRTQYFRVLHQPAEGDPEWSEFPPVVLKFQRLPASFRAHISEEGEWIQPGRLRHGNIIFDHTVSPPGLPPQP